MTKSQDWHPEDIKAAIRKRGMTTSQLSRCHGLLATQEVRRGTWI
ncbi:helix-turn-helix domain-containing protein [Citrobacter freundii]